MSTSSFESFPVSFEMIQLEDCHSLRGCSAVADSHFLYKIFNKTVFFFYSQSLLSYNDIMKTANQHQPKKRNLHFQMPFQAFLHINVLLIEFSCECGWLHIT